MTLVPYDSVSQEAAAILSDLTDDNFFEIQERMDALYRENPNADGYKQWKRLENFLEPRVYPYGRMENMEARNLRAFIKVERAGVPGTSRSTHGGWLSYGPNTISGGQMGRINCVDFHPSDPNTIYVGSASGGVWKTTNGGSSWFPISPNIPSLAVGDIEIDPGNPNVIYLATGDPYNNGRPSIGMLKSTDGGSTWQTTALKTALTDHFYIEKMLMHPTNPNIQYLATNKGIYRTSNGWSDDSYTVSGAGLRFFDLEFKPNDPSVIYGTMFSTNPFVRSTNNGTSWSTVFDPLVNSILGGANKIELAVTAHNVGCIYLYGGLGGSIGLLRSLDLGNVGSWTVRDTAIGNLGAQSSYNMSLVASDDNYNNIFLGQVWTKRSTNGGLPGSWVGPSNTVHADVHETKFHDGTVYHCNDGGLYKSIDNGVTFTELSQGMAITEIYRIGGTPAHLGVILAGTQDNGTFKRNISGSASKVGPNDGGTCLINYLNSNIAYLTSQDGWIYKSTDGVNFPQINVPQQGMGPFITPMVMDPTNPDILFFGMKNVYRSNNALAAGSFVDLGKPTPGADGHIIDMKQGVDNRNRLYVSSGGRLYRTSNALTTTGPASWTQINNELGDSLWITDITVDPLNANRIFITCSGYYDGKKVFFSGNFGNAGSWVNISGNLPNVPFNCIQFHNNGLNNDALYVGSDIGVFYRDDDHADWIYFSNGMPSVRVNDLYINEGSDILVAGTYGRGLWVSALHSDCPNNITILNSSAAGTIYYSAAQTITSTDVYPLDFSTNIHYSAGNYIDLKDGFRLGGSGFMDAKIGPCNNTIYEGMISADPVRELKISGADILQWFGDDVN